MELLLCKSCNKRTAVLEEGRCRCMLCGAETDPPPPEPQGAEKTVPPNAQPRSS